MFYVFGVFSDRKYEEFNIPKNIIDLAEPILFEI